MDMMEHPGLAGLEAQVRRDLELVAHPRMEWMVPRPWRGRPALDVLIVGAGQGGLAVGFGLWRDRVRNVLLVDRAAAGQEGPWVTYARMRTLRSPKDQNGPDLGIPSLTFQAWFEAQHGAEAFAAMHLIPAVDWQAYLGWFRRVTALPVRSGVAVERLDPGTLDDGGRCLVATLSSGEAVAARKVVLATGQDGTGRWWMPDFVEALPPHLRAHTCEAIDFERLRGKVVAVLGAGASAMDNAAVALEHGAEAHVFCRQPDPAFVQRYRWLTFAGFMKHIGDMPDEWRWRMVSQILLGREGFPPETYRRAAAHEAFRMHLGRGWTGAAEQDGRVRIETPRGPFMADYVISGTGQRQDVDSRPELAAFAGEIALWRHRYTPPPGEEDEGLGAYPYLGPDFAFQERTPGAAPHLADIHLFGIGATMSFGPSGSSINAMTTAAPRVVDGVTRGLFAGDIERHHASLRAYGVRQVELDEARTVRGP